MKRPLVAALCFTVAAACANSSDTPVDDAGTIDAGPTDVLDAKPPIEAAATCGDAKKNGTETDIDCGGACAKCDDGKTCAAATDCREGACFLGKCGATAWFAESTGSNVLLNPNQTWVAAPGLALTPTLYEDATVFLRFTGTSRWAGGGNGLCAIGQRFVIDGKPTGNPSWGNAILVQRGGTRWHEMFTTELAVSLQKGPHQISAEVVNGTGFGACYLDGDGGQNYDRSRLAAAAFDPKASWSAESTAGTGYLAPGGWTPIPGVSIAAKLAAPAHVQLSLTGSQVVGGSNVGHCVYRLVIDGTPLGNPTHGQAVNVGDVGGGWWSPLALKYGIDLPAGAHTFSADISNSSAQGGTCQAGEGNNDYAKFRLFADAVPQSGPSTSRESSGPSNVLGTGSPWTPVSGLSAPITLATDTNVQMELAATQRNVSGSGHCAWRFVIDGTPLGQVDHGQQINVGDGAYTWWKSESRWWGQPLTAGPHTIGVDVRNSSNSGDCGTNADSEPYSRARLLIRVP